VTLDQIASAATALGVTGLLFGALFGLYRQWWVPGWVFRAKEAECAEWKLMAIHGLEAAAEVAKAAKRHTTFTPEEADLARRVIREAGEVRDPEK
jgi:hypothetical protein